MQTLYSLLGIIFSNSCSNNTVTANSLLSLSAKSSATSFLPSIKHTPSDTISFMGVSGVSKSISESSAACLANAFLSSVQPARSLMSILIRSVVIFFSNSISLHISLKSAACCSQAIITWLSDNNSFSATDKFCVQRKSVSITEEAFNDSLADLGSTFILSPQRHKRRVLFWLFMLGTLLLFSFLKIISYRL